MIVAEIKLKRTTDKEDWYILSSQHPENTQVTYILSLGVFKEFRRLGVASLLLDTLISYLKAETDCKAIYLHVLCSNQVAIRFYEKRHFQQRIYLPNYYTIKGQLQDGHCYVLYMNNGQPPCTLADCFKEAWSFFKVYNPLKIFTKSISILNTCIRNVLFNLNRNYFTAKDFYRIS
jgi:GNAT superfamily N-acetyltransferase